jgi:hypothetical protein
MPARSGANLILLAVLATSLLAQTPETSTLKSLYAHRQWTDLYRAA